MVGAVGAEALVLEAGLSEPRASKAVVDQTWLCLAASMLPSISQARCHRSTCSRRRTYSREAGLALKLHGARRLTIAARGQLRRSPGRFLGDFAAAISVVADRFVSAQRICELGLAFRSVGAARRSAQVGVLLGCALP